MGRKIERRKEEEPESNPCPFPPEDRENQPTSPSSDSPVSRFSRTQILAIGLTILSFSTIFVITQWQAVFVPLQGENIILNVHFGASGHDSACLYQTADGRILFYGQTTSWGLGGARSGTDGWMGEIDLYGNILWNSTFGTIEDDYIESFVECDDGGFAMAGTTFSWKNGTYDNDILLIRTDQNGNMLWNKTLGGIECDREPHLLLCSDGGFAIAAMTNNFGAEKFDMWLIRTDGSGNPIWNSTFGGSEYDCLSCALSMNSGFILVGSLSVLTNSSSFNPDVYLVCTDENGNMLWNQTYGDWQNDDGYYMLPLNSGGYLIVGQRGQHPYYRNIWLIRVNEAFEVLWEKIVGPIGANCMDFKACSSGGFVFVGYYRFNDAHNSEDFYMGRIDNDGNLLWERRFGLSENYEMGASIIELEDRSFLIAGANGIWPGDVWLLRVVDVSPTQLTMLYVVFGILGTILAIAIISLSVYLIRRARERRTM